MMFIVFAALRQIKIHTYHQPEESEMGIQSMKNLVGGVQQVGSGCTLAGAGITLCLFKIH